MSMTNAQVALMAATNHGTVDFKVAAECKDWLDMMDAPPAEEFVRCVYALNDGGPLKQCRQHKGHDGSCMTEEGRAFNPVPFFGRA